MATTTNYRSTHFEVKQPIIITGESTYESLSTLHDQINTNAQSVPSNEGGGSDCHLGLVLSQVEYQLITLTPFTRPINPQEFVYPPGATHPPEHITVLRRAHLDKHQCSQVFWQVELALKK